MPAPERLVSSIESAVGADNPASEGFRVRRNGRLSDEGSADATPTTAQVAGKAVLDRDVAGVMSRWRALRTTEVAAINRRLKASGVAEIDPEAKSEQEDDADDSDLE